MCIRDRSITAATVAAWHKGSGDAVARGDTLVTLETDKVSTDLEADEDGMLEILVPEGAEAPIGAVLSRFQIRGDFVRFQRAMCIRDRPKACAWLTAMLPLSSSVPPV